MKVDVTIVIFVYCFMSSAANDILPSDLLNGTKCHDQLITLNFSNAVISDISQDFISSPIITCLNLEHNQIKNIAKGAFDQLPNLTNLYLSSNNIYNLFEFGSHNKLQVLWLDENNKNIYSYNARTVEVFSTYSSLEFLSMRQNGLKDLSDGYYSRYGGSMTEMIFPKLKYLDLSENYISGDNFVQLLPKSLMYLYLHGNSLYSLQLNNTKELTVLTLDNNRLSKVSYYLLNSWENLNYLSVSNNQINEIEQTAFIDAFKLKYLNFSNNDLHYIDSTLFTHLKSLKTLDLSNNKLTVIPTSFSISNINVLLLNGNEITSINSNTFVNMPKLIELSLKNNQLNETYVDDFANLYYLVKLDLSSNKLSSLLTGWTESFISLKYLDLSDNQFISLESLHLTKEMPLLELYLDTNVLKSFNVRSIENLPQNVTVNLIEKSNI